MRHKIKEVDDTLCIPTASLLEFYHNYATSKKQRQVLFSVIRKLREACLKGSVMRWDMQLQLIKQKETQVIRVYNIPDDKESINIFTNDPGNGKLSFQGIELLITFNSVDYKVGASFISCTGSLVKSRSLMRQWFTPILPYTRSTICSQKYRDGFFILNTCFLQTISERLLIHYTCLAGIKKIKLISKGGKYVKTKVKHKSGLQKTDR